MPDFGQYSLRNPWLRNSLFVIAGITVVSVLIGFVWLPSLEGDFSAQGIWSSICRAAGAPTTWDAGKGIAKPDVPTTRVVLRQSMALPGSNDAVGLGATLALQCTICHGARGLTQTDAPNLAGQYPEVIIKQLIDYRNGDRISSVMQAFAKRLSDDDVRELAAYYAYLPRATTLLDAAGSIAPAIVRVGDPMKNIAPCSSCHGDLNHKLGAPRLDGMPSEYLAAQLTAFQNGNRHNDAHAQMRNMARRLAAQDAAEIVAFYARH
jgi:cytochrome c553